jgi:hypothetical protein
MVFGRAGRTVPPIHHRPERDVKEVLASVTTAQSGPCD